jgi:hypothetical protein
MARQGENLAARAFGLGSCGVARRVPFGRRLQMIGHRIMYVGRDAGALQRSAHRSRAFERTT